MNSFVTKAKGRLWYNLKSRSQKRKDKFELIILKKNREIQKINDKQENVQFLSPLYTESTLKLIRMKVQNVIEKWAKNIQQQVRFHFYEQYATEKSTREELLARNWVFHTDAFSTKKWDDGLGGILFPRGGKKKAQL